VTEVENALECEVVDVELQQSMSGKVAGVSRWLENGDRVGRPRSSSFRVMLAKKIGANCCQQGRTADADPSFPLSRD
jgi:hypothetical protein